MSPLLGSCIVLILAIGPGAPQRTAQKRSDAPPRSTQPEPGAPVPRSPGILYVDDDAPIGGNGTSWQLAYSSLQDALDDAASAGGTHSEIRVAVGVYRPSQRTIASDPRSVTFTMLNGVSLRGGYAGFGAADPDARDFDATPSSLSGDLDCDDGPDWENYGENAYHIVTASGTDATTLVEGFTISNGNAEGETSTTTVGRNGAGVYCVQGSPVISDCLFTRHSMRGIGGAVFFEGGTPTMLRSRFYANGNPDRYAYCAGIYCDDVGSCAIIDCMFAGNYGDHGAAVRSDLGAVNLIGCIISGNSGYSSPIEGTHNITLTNCVVAFNTKLPILPDSTSGAAGIGVTPPRLTVTNSIIWGNSNAEGDSFDAQIATYSPATPQTYRYNCIQGLADDFPGVGNIGDDPLFVDPDGPDNVPGTLDDDYSLRNGSPCIDAGDNDADTNRVAPGIQPLPLTDADGNLRFLDDPLTADTGNGTSPIVDMGAYESPRASFEWDATDVTVGEGGSATVHVRLTGDPGGPLVATVTRASGDADIAVQVGVTLNFDSSSYDIPQRVMFTAVADADYFNGTATMRVSAPGYTPADVFAHESDIDPAPTIVYVKPSAIGAEDGRSWDNAFTDLQQALDAQANRSEIEQVWVAEGTYRPSQRVISQNPRTATFSLAGGLAIYGGFEGTEGTLDERDPALHPTILSGDLNCNDIGDFDSPTRYENAYSVVSAINVGETAILDGFSITLGHANKIDPQANGKSGAGLSARASNLSLKRCEIRENFSLNAGAGFSVQTESELEMTDCKIESNAVGTLATTGSGGNTGYVSESNSVFTDCAFTNNRATGYSSYGGSLGINRGMTSIAYCTFQGNAAVSTPSGSSSRAGGIIVNDAVLTMMNCQIIGNSADSAGGVLLSNDVIGIIEDCEFVQNSSTELYGDAGALDISRSDLVLVTGTLFEENTARASGGGIFCDSAAQVLDCTFHANVGQASSAGGGAVAFGGAVFEECVFSENHANNGGGLYLYGNIKDQSTVRRCRFDSNWAAFDGGGLLASYGEFEACEFIGNLADEGGGLHASNSRVIGCRFFGNEADGPSSAQVGGGGAYLSGESQISDCLFSGNWSEADGGAMAMAGNPSARIGSCTFVGNTTDAEIGGVDVSGYAEVENSIFWDNGPEPSESAQIGGDNLFLSHNCIQGLTGTIGGEGNFNADPLFADLDGPDDAVGTDDDDFHLTADSPCVNTGDSYADPLSSTDVDGEPRIQQCRLDIGADESLYDVFVDCNGNGVSDSCEIRDGDEPDCNQNEIPDACDLESGESDDRNHNGVPDECEMRIIHVDASATPPGDGRRWHTAYADLQGALAAAEEHSGEVQIWIAAGTYRPAAPSGPRAATFLLSNRVGLYGGFAGHERFFGRRDPDTNVTILSGDLNADDAPASACCLATFDAGCDDPDCEAEVIAERPSCAELWNSVCAQLAASLCDLDCMPTNGDNSEHVVSAYYLSGPVVVDGLTITGGNSGGPVLINTGFGTDNRGGGLHLVESNVSFRECRIVENRAFIYGGGMFQHGGDVVFEHTVWEGNAAREGGGAYVIQEGLTRFYECQFIGNSGDGVLNPYSQRGAALLATGASTIDVAACIFDGNLAASGGIINVSHGTATIQRSVFMNHTTSGVMIEASSTAHIMNSLFTHNEAPRGSAVYMRGKDPSSLVGCTITANAGTYDDGAVFVDSIVEEFSIVNCIVSGNVSNASTIERQQISGWTEDAQISFCCIEGLDQFAGNGNIGADPLFVDAANDDYRLAAGSPCIDAGDNGVFPADALFDLADRPRFVDDAATPDTGTGTPPIVDIGAYEYPLPPIEVAIDIRPRKCPNRINRNAHGVFRIAVLGSSDFDVHSIDLGSLRLERADGVGGAAQPHLLPPVLQPLMYRDLAEPYPGAPCGCWHHGHDGQTDLVLRFRIPEVVDALEFDALPLHEVVPLRLSGRLQDHSDFQGTDCIRLFGP